MVPVPAVAMVVGVSRIEMLFKHSRSLKEKRKIIRSLIGKISHRFNVSIAEIDYHDLRQRGAIAVAHVGRTQADVKKLLGKVRDFSESACEGEIVSARETIYCPDKDE